uniref:Spindle assembly abnormal protein 6 homolog n=1 Tax=Strongyloides papillosus TaxID=174720 RepID=A0A0N5BTY7_STREA
MTAFKTKVDDNITSTIPSIAQDHLLGLNVFDNISTIHFGEYPLEVVMECIRLNTRKSINIFDKYSKANDFQNHNGILDVVRDPNIESIFQNSNSYLCLFPTMWLTIIGQTLDSWIKFYSKCNITSLTQELLDTKAEINRLEKHVNSLNAILEKKTLLINKLHKKIDITKKPSEKLIEANNRISKLEEMVAALTEQNKALCSEKEHLSDEVRQLKGQCKNFERMNNEKENRYKALQRSSKSEKAELDQKIKTLKNQCKKSELALLEKMYDMEIEGLQKYKNEAIEKLEKWNTLSGDIFNRNSDAIIKNKEIINKYINDVSEQINTATNNYKKNITLIEDGKSFSQISKAKPKNVRRCPSTNYDHLIDIQKLETVTYDGISVSPMITYKRKSNLKITSKNQFNSSYRQDARTSCSSDSQSKVSNVVEDVFSNCGHFDKNDFLVTSNKMEYYSSNNSWVSDDFERRDFNFHDSLSPAYNGTGGIKESNTPRNNVFSPYPDPPRSGFINNENQFFSQINPVCSPETNTITSNIRTVKSLPLPIQPPNTFPGKHYIQSENENPYITSQMSPFYKKAPDNFSNTISKNNHTPSHLNFNNYLYGNNCLNGQLITKNQYIPNSTDDNFSRLLKDFSSEQSSNNMW